MLPHVTTDSPSSDTDRGLPIAKTHCPGRRVSESPNSAVGHGPSLSAVVPTLNVPDDVPAEVADRVAEVHEQIMEAVIEADESLLDRYFGGEEIAPEELSNGVAAAISLEDDATCRDVDVARVQQALESQGVRIR